MILASDKDAIGFALKLTHNIAIHTCHGDGKGEKIYGIFEYFIS